jgi:hypothetical protein
MIPHVVRPRNLAAAVLVALALGCGGGVVPPPPSDPAQARAALRAALDAWQQGQEPDALQGRSPPVHVADEDWLAGRRLLRYQVEDAGRPVGLGLRFAVKLSLGDASGNPSEKRVRYLVHTNPGVSIVREDS